MRIIFLIILNLIQSLLFTAPVFAAATISVPSGAPTKIQINQTFIFNATLTGVQIGETYFVKCRLGQSSSDLTDGQTYNQNTNIWLSDTGAWTNMPIVTASDTSVTFPIQCRIKSGAVAEQKVLYSRACLKKSDGTCGTSFQSSSSVNLIADPEPVPSPSASASSSTNPSSSFSVSNVPAEINSDQSFSIPVNINLPNSPNTTFYLKGAFKKADSSNYFGQTKVSSSWIKNYESYSNQYQVTTDSSGNWSGNLEAEPDILDSGYDGAGTYIFKVGKYNSSGDLTWSNEANIQISVKEVSDKNSNTIKPTGNPQNSDSDSVVSDQNLSDEVFSLEKYRHTASVAGTATATPLVKVDSQKQNNSFPLIFLGGGLILGAISYIIYTIIKHKRYDSF